VGNTESMKQKRPELVRVTHVKQRSHRDAIRVPLERCVRAQKKYEQNPLKRSASLEMTRLRESTIGFRAAAFKAGLLFARPSSLFSSYGFRQPNTD
jgi:hypothetical protein